MSAGDPRPVEPDDGVPPLVSAAQLANSIADGAIETGAVVVCDVRWDLSAGARRDDYVGGHVPGAVFVALDVDLSAPPTPASGRHPLPDPADFAATRTRLGFGDDSWVIAYDAAGGIHAARLWWMLTVIGVRASVLDGGLDAWAADGERPVEEGWVEPTPSAPVAERPWPATAIAELAEVEAIAAGTSDTTLLDARAAARFRGEIVAVDPRPGHIPNARSAETAGNLRDDPGNAGAFRTPSELRQRYESLGAGGDDVIVSCGSGVTACHDALAMVVAGLALPRLYVGSFSQWSADPERPVAQGAG